MLRFPLAIALLVLMLVAPALAMPLVDAPSSTATAARLRSFDLVVTIEQHRPWTYYHQQTSPECTRTTEGFGSDDLTMVGKVLFHTSPGGGTGSTGVAIPGKFSRKGVRTRSVSGGGCELSEPASDENSGCGMKDTRPSFPALTLRGGKLRLRWAGADPIPAFSACPYFGGSNDAAAGKELPGSGMLDISAPLSAKKLRGRAKRIHVAGTTRRNGIENCANLAQPCPPGVTYNATAKVDASFRIVFTRRKR